MSQSVATISAAVRTGLRATLARRVQAGERPRDVALSCHVSLSTVRRACREFGVVPHDRGRPGVRTVQVIARLINAAGGVTHRDIARELGCSRQLVKQVHEAAMAEGIRLGEVAHA